MNSHKTLSLFIVLFACVVSISHASTNFFVGGEQGWVLQPKEGYNHWASRQKFQVNDTLVFKFAEGSDSVLVVGKHDYFGCNTNKSIKKMTNGRSEFQFPHSGPFFFISGKEGHCRKGQKLITVVMSEREGITPTAAPPHSHVPVTHQPPATSPVAAAPHSPKHHGGPVSQPPKASSPVADSPAHSPKHHGGAVSEPPKASSPVAAAPAHSPMHHAPVSSPPKASSPVEAAPATSPQHNHHVPDSSPSPVSSPPKESSPVAPAHSPEHHHGPVSSPSPVSEHPKTSSPMAAPPISPEHHHGPVSSPPPHSSTLKPAPAPAPYTHNHDSQSSAQSSHSPKVHHDHDHKHDVSSPSPSPIPYFAYPKTLPPLSTPSGPVDGRTALPQGNSSKSSATAATYSSLLVLAFSVMLFGVVFGGF